MIREKEQLFRKLLMIVDIIVVLFAFLLAWLVRKNIHIFYILDLFPEKQVIEDLYHLSKYFNILPLIVFSWCVSLSCSGLYKSFRRKNFSEIVVGIIKSTFFVMLIFATVTFILKLHFVRRSLIVISFLITDLLLIIERWVIVSILRFLRKKGHDYRNVLVVGTGSRARNFIKLVDRHDEWGLRIIGLMDAEKGKLEKTICGKKVIGLLRDMPDILKRNVVDEVIFIVPRKWLSRIEDSLLACEIQGVRASISADFFDMKIARSISSDIEGIPLLGFETTEGNEWQLLLKRLFDIIFSLIGIIVTLPLFAIIIVIIKCSSPGPAIFKQARKGLHGREFIMYKFRTMVNGAEDKKDELISFNEMNGPIFKMHNDPRVTKFGSFLRMTSLDELPQIFNVVKGDMSLVGPRPHPTSEVKEYQVWHRRRLSRKPGLTCLWQINGRSNADFEKCLKMDLKYIDNWSLALDFKILLKTVPVVLFSIGAR